MCCKRKLNKIIKSYKERKSDTQNKKKYILKQKNQAKILLETIFELY